MKRFAFGAELRFLLLSESFRALEPEQSVHDDLPSVHYALEVMYGLIHGVGSHATWREWKKMTAQCGDVECGDEKVRHMHD